MEVDVDVDRARERLRIGSGRVQAWVGEMELGRWAGANTV